MSGHRHRIEERNWIFFWIDRWRFFCAGCDARGPWRKDFMHANSDGLYHETAMELNDLLGRLPRNS